jgi:DNA-directed RNA polymerase specialized sigma24 family protein
MVINATARKEFRATMELFSFCMVVIPSSTAITAGDPISMSVSQEISAHIPYLRRFGRALSGSQGGGDAYVLATLEAIVADPEAFREGGETRTSLYRTFLALWGSMPVNEHVDPNILSPDERGARRNLDAIPLRPRVAFLLASLEGFDTRQVASILGEPEVDAAVDCVGFEARGCGTQASKTEQPASVLNALMGSVRAGGAIGIPGLYVTEDPGAADAAAKIGALSLRLGLGWAKSISFGTGQCPVIKYHRQLMQAILFEKIKPARAVNVRVVSLEDAPAAYADFDKGARKK